MIELPKLPKAINRDETEHGKLYYTRKQMIDFAKSAVDMHCAKQSEESSVEALSMLFGFKK